MHTFQAEPARLRAEQRAHCPRGNRKIGACPVTNQRSSTMLRQRLVRSISPGVRLQLNAARMLGTAAPGQTAEKYDYIVVGAGSGGMASARRAAAHGAKVAIIESGRLGGTCVNVGCVPKKVMWSAAEMQSALNLSPDYGFSWPGEMPSFDWQKLKTSRDSYIERLNGIYQRNLDNSAVEVVLGRGQLVGPRPGGSSGAVVAAGGRLLESENVLLATGGYPIVPAVAGAAEVGVTSDGFFDIEALPKRVAVFGAGYIAVELAGILRGLGSEVSLFIRHDKVLRSFDSMLSTKITESLEHSGVQLVRNSSLAGVRKAGGSPGDVTIDVHDADGKAHEHTGFDEVVYAIGRAPAVPDLNLAALGEDSPLVADSGHIASDEFQCTRAPGVFALGDVCGHWELTPVAIAAGRRLADRLFAGPSFAEAKLDYDTIPTVIFSHPPAGTIGLSEEEAIARYGEDDIHCYTSTFVNMHYAIMNVDPSEKPRTNIKLVCQGAEEKIVGLHIHGMAADEMLQGFAVAIKMGACKSDLDNTIAIHPTAAEEVVTLAPWGLPKES